MPKVGIIVIIIIIIKIIIIIIIIIIIEKNNKSGTFKAKIYEDKNKVFGSKS